MILTRKRGSVYHYDSTRNGTRIRVSLGTKIPMSARTLCRQIDLAFAEGEKSEHWNSLRHVLPSSSFMVLTRGMKIKAPATLDEFQKHYEARLDAREILGEITAGTRDLHRRISAGFFAWLRPKVQKMDEITSQLISEYLVARKQEFLDKGKTGRGLAADNSVLSGVFKIAVDDDVLSASPFRQKAQITSEPREVLPFSEDELNRMAQHVDYETRLPFLVFRWTGLRISDVEALAWSSVNFGTKTIRVIARKNKKEAVIPMVEELYDALWKKRCSDQGTKVLPDWPKHRLSKMVKDLAAKAGVFGAHPHRFRHSLACTILARGGSMWEVAKVLGDTTSVVEKHYSKFTDGMQERVRGILEGK